MDPHDTFPQRVWHIVASIPEGYVATYGDVARLAGSPRAARQVGGVLKRLPEGSTLPLASGGQSPWRYLPHRARSSATAPGVAGRRGSGLRQRPYRSPALSLGLLKTKKSPRQGARRAYCATGTAVCVTGTSVRSACVPLVYHRLHGIGNEH